MWGSRLRWPMYGFGPYGTHHLTHTTSYNSTHGGALTERNKLNYNIYFYQHVACFHTICSCTCQDCFSELWSNTVKVNHATAYDQNSVPISNCLVIGLDYSYQRSGYNYATVASIDEPARRKIEAWFSVEIDNTGLLRLISMK